MEKEIDCLWTIELSPEGNKKRNREIITDKKLNVRVISHLVLRLE